jgi:protein-arginine kinase activator protein McsA
LAGIDFHRNFDSLTRTINHINNFHMNHTQTLHKNLQSKIDVMRQLNTKEESFKKLIARGEIAQAKKRSQSNKEN